MTAVINFFFLPNTAYLVNPQGPFQNSVWSSLAGFHILFSCKKIPAMAVTKGLFMRPMCVQKLSHSTSVMQQRHNKANFVGRSIATRNFPLSLRIGLFRSHDTTPCQRIDRVCPDAPKDQDSLRSPSMQFAHGARLRPLKSLKRKRPNRRRQF